MLFISVSTLGGAAYFKEFSSFGVLQWIMFPLGILCTLTGVYILSSREVKKGINCAPGEISQKNIRLSSSVCDAAIAQKKEADKTSCNSTEKAENCSKATF